MSTSALPKQLEPGQLLEIQELLLNDSSLHPPAELLSVSLSDDFSYVRSEDLSETQRRTLGSLVEKSGAEGLLLPRSPEVLSVVPVRGVVRAVLEEALRGVSWGEAVAQLGSSELQRLFVLGILGIKLSQGRVSGAAAQLLITAKTSGAIPAPLVTDWLSEKALNHVARLSLSDPVTATAKLYAYNSEPIPASRLLRETTAFVQDFAERRAVEHFIPVPAPEDNPGWYMFVPRGGQNRERGGGSFCKLYISPTVRDVRPCLTALLSALPSLPVYSWKVGRFSYGIARPDKICVYFTSLDDARDSAVYLHSILSGLGAQGVPFTRLHDESGLISLAIDPQKQPSLAEFTAPNSWRLWVSRKMAAAMLLARRHRHYPLSPVQSALWTLCFLGVDPETWTVHNENFWSN